MLRITQSNQDVQIGTDDDLMKYVFKYALKAEVLRKVADKYQAHGGMNQFVEATQPQGGEMFMELCGVRPVQYASNVQKVVYYVPTLDRLEQKLPEEWVDYLAREGLGLGDDVNHMSFAEFMSAFYKVGSHTYKRFTDRL